MKISQTARLIAIIAGLQFSFLASVSCADVILSKSERTAATWDNAYSITTMGFADDTNNIAVGRQSVWNSGSSATSGLGQSFTATADGVVDNIGLGVLRFYSGQTGTMTIYQMFDGNGVTPGANPTRFRNGNADWMSDPIAQFTFNTSDASISGSSDPERLVNFALTGADQFSVVSGGTYMVQLAGDPGNTVQPSLMLWHRNDSDPYADGIYGLPNGGTTASGRDVMLGINIVSAVPEPSSAAVLAVGFLGLLVRRRKT